MKHQIELLSNVTTTIDGEWTDLRGVGDGTTLCTAYLGAGGGTASVNIETRMLGGPPTLQVTFTLSGANDNARYIIDKENWPQIRARVTSISGAVVNSAIGI